MDRCALKMVARRKSRGRNFGKIQGNENNKCQRRKYRTFNTLKTKRRLLYLKTQFIPRCKHFSSRLSFYDVSGTSRCLFSDKNKTYK